jgi:hypothetical protein
MFLDYCLNNVKFCREKIDIFGKISLYSCNVYKSSVISN